MPHPCRSCPVCDLAPNADACIGTLAVNHTSRSRLAVQAYDLTYCDCGELVYISPLPSRQDILAMYAESAQFADKDSVESPYRGEHAIAVLEYITSQFLSILRLQRIGTDSPIKVLEVGAGLSWMCRAAKIANWDNLTVAQDLTTEAISECRWVDHYIVEDMIEGTSFDPHGPFDVISLTHVFEHLAEPVAMLRRLGGLLAPKGVIFITAPHRPAGWQRGSAITEWEPWSYNHTPAHIQYFARGSFEKAAEAARLEVAAWNDQHEDGQAFEGWLRHIGVVDG